jgi:hypothetical protein
MGIKNTSQDAHAGVCPKCGHCPTCGRSNQPQGFYPPYWPYGQYPYYWPYTGAPPTQWISGGTTVSGSTTINTPLNNLTLTSAA